MRGIGVYTAKEGDAGSHSKEGCKFFPMSADERDVSVHRKRGGCRSTFEGGMQVPSANERDVSVIREANLGNKFAAQREDMQLFFSAEVREGARSQGSRERCKSAAQRKEVHVHSVESVPNKK